MNYLWACIGIAGILLLLYLFLRRAPDRHGHGNHDSWQGGDMRDGGGD